MVGTTATSLTGGSRGYPPGCSVVIYNPGPTEVVVGDTSVTATTGLSLPAGASLQADLEDNEFLYGVVASGTQIVHCLEVGI